MSSKSPIVRQVAFFSLLAQLMVLSILISLFYAMDVDNFILFGTLSYLLISLGLRRFIPRCHRKGIAYFKEKRFDLAIEQFAKSYDFFKKHYWVDQYRYIILLSSSRISYTEMSLLNIAFSYAQIGDGNRSKFYYEKTLEEFPNSEMAKMSLNMLSSVS